MAAKPKVTKRVPPPAKLPRCIINDATSEKVAEILSRDPSGSLMVHDELAGWFDSFERYSSGSSRAFYLSCWNGGPFSKDRVAKGAQDPAAEIHVDNLALSILGGIQPDKLAKLRDLTSDGLLQRFLPVLMPSAKRGDEYHPVAGAEADYEVLIKAINDAPPQNYHFEDDALEVRDRVIDYLHKLEQVDGYPVCTDRRHRQAEGIFCAHLSCAARWPTIRPDGWQSAGGLYVTRKLYARRTRTPSQAVRDRTDGSN